VNQKELHSLSLMTDLLGLLFLCTASLWFSVGMVGAQQELFTPADSMPLVPSQHR
jgi:hypothetical protein